MKQIFLAAILLITISAQAQWPFQKVSGNGNIKKETRNASGYTEVSTSGSWDVMIAYGESNTIEVEGDENLLPYIETKVEGNKLSIKSKNNTNLNTRNKITIYVSLTRLTGISLSGSGDVIGNGKFFNTGDTKLSVSGSGTIKLAANKLDKVTVTVSGSGNARIAGSASAVSARISGSGNIDCAELVSDDAEAHISGSGNIKLNANKSIDANISGSGDVSYRGSASDIKKHVSGSGRLSKI